ncbi:SAM-dependent MidA family methyltransferase [Sphingomonas jejuensis]|uniref:SAM-dependent MidA family methyltransferase n=1 Tax=Sphingomonas jejuensis TaxID=904715 RepID=A0ABX0XME3_9SPHN|nr:SAM-dependent methyltransferase [Sphingomonas jejuensis]NJC33916.1 SAM-dependent MidA family methyltransferase [Sphingomonas jejuensis]
MGAANAHYYATRDPLGAEGDFTTAPEISQMFGELVGLALADLWHRAGRPPVHYVELGPGRGTLAADALRAMASAGLRPAVHFVETSPALRARQAAAVPAASFHDGLATVPADAAWLVVANEFFDALPIRQLVRTPDGWQERKVVAHGDLFLPLSHGPVLDGLVPEHLADAPIGSILESAPASVAIVRTLAKVLAARGGAALVIDYGYEGPAVGDTLQAVSRHRFANPYEAPGTRDLTAHVDFATLAEAAAAEGVRTSGPVPQGVWLERLGIAQRAIALSAGSPARSAEIAAARDRLVGAGEMGTLFKALALSASTWPEPAGFAA